MDIFDVFPVQNGTGLVEDFDFRDDFSGAISDAIIRGISFDQDRSIALQDLRGVAVEGCAIITTQEYRADFGVWLG